MKSVISGWYIVYSYKQDDNEIEETNSTFPVLNENSIPDDCKVSLYQPNAEPQVSQPEALIITIESESDWLEAPMTAWIGMTNASVKICSFNAIDKMDEVDERLKPFTPNLSGVWEMEIIRNILKVKDL